MLLSAQFLVVVFKYSMCAWIQCTFRIPAFGDGSNIMDLEDFIVSNNLLPLGSLGYLLFCTRKNGWGWDNFIAEVNAGTGMKFPEMSEKLCCLWNSGDYHCDLSERLL